MARPLIMGLLLWFSGQTKAPASELAGALRIDLFELYKMQLIISCIEDKNFDFRFGSTQLSYDEASMTFSLPYPIGDDWLQRKCFSPDQTPSLVRIHDECVFMVFEKYDAAKNFSDSVLEASKQSDHSYKTLRG